MFYLGVHNEIGDFGMIFCISYTKVLASCLDYWWSETCKRKCRLFQFEKKIGYSFNFNSIPLQKPSVLDLVVTSLFSSSVVVFPSSTHSFFDITGVGVGSFCIKITEPYTVAIFVPNTIILSCNWGSLLKCKLSPS